MKVQDQNFSDRKKDHIELATLSQVSGWSNDKRFYYEPLLGSHAQETEKNIPIFKKSMKFPLWVSSMTGGTPEAKKINENLAQACAQFGLGMGLGSCRVLLADPEKNLSEFKLRGVIGKDQPFFANLGIAQLELELKNKNLSRVEDLIGMLEADGLIIHINPLQEWLQPEGDKFSRKPIDTIQDFISKSKTDVIVKEVGQGMGPESLLALMKLPVMIEFGAYGGTNFSQLEISRSNGNDEKNFQDLVNIGHNIDEMIEYVNEIGASKHKLLVKGFITSGGIKNFLDGYYAVEKIRMNAVYGQASELLKKARISYPVLEEYISKQIEGYRLAEQFLSVR